MTNQIKENNFLEKISIGKNIRKSYKKTIEINTDLLNKSRNKSDLSMESISSLRNQQDSSRKK